MSDERAGQRNIPGWHEQGPVGALWHVTSTSVVGGTLRLFFLILPRVLLVLQSGYCHIFHADKERDRAPANLSSSLRRLRGQCKRRHALAAQHPFALAFD